MATLIFRVSNLLADVPTPVPEIAHIRVKHRHDDTLWSGEGRTPSVSPLNCRPLDVTIYEWNAALARRGRLRREATKLDFERVEQRQATRLVIWMNFVLDAPRKAWTLDQAAQPPGQRSERQMVSIQDSGTGYNQPVETPRERGCIGIRNGHDSGLGLKGVG